MNIIGIIPARFASTRFPGKPLVDIKGKTMIQRVYENSKKVLGDHLLIATDNSLIAEEANKFGGNVILTAKDHKNGTDRCAEAMERYETRTGKRYDIIINIQGDEPFLHEEHLTKLISCFDDPATEIATLIKEIELNEDIFNPNKPKVIRDINNFAVYFSRSPIPYLRAYDKEEWHKHYIYYKHIGLYAYRKNILKKITKIPTSGLEIAESLEQNRWIENGYKIKIEITDKESLSIDTPEDLEQILKKDF
jgi:3-deoxy-manno-octulosonate cytidylyltransferase (CMP-KDO synthetase)